MYEITISPIKLLDAGYKFFKQYSDEVSTRATWQKQIEDERGIKYFINIVRTDGFLVGDTEPCDSCFWWPSVQFRIPVGDGFQTIYVELVQWLNNSGQHTGLTIEMIEQQLHEIWTKLSGQYYELKNEEYEA